MNEPSTDWKETVADGEEERFGRFAEELLTLQRRLTRNRPAARGLHFKAHGGAEATFTVLGDLPEHLRQGLFAEPAEYKAYVRFSNGMGFRQADSKPDVRGLAIKVVGVEGDKILPGMEGAKTQDFLAINQPSSPLANTEQFVALAIAGAGSPLKFLPRYAARIGWGTALASLPGVARMVLSSFDTFAGRHLHTGLPVRYGPYAACFIFVPRTPAEGSASGSADGPDRLATDLRDRLASAPLEWDIAVQFFVDEQRTPIEDASVPWKETDSPPQTVARLTVPSQDLSSERGKRVAEYVETLSFDPWHALVEHRPLGDMMRGRKAAYYLSTKERGAAAEPEGGESF